MGVHGTKLCGKVGRVPRVGYVATRFFHLNYLPIIPLGSFAVLEGTHRNGRFSGSPVPLNVRSILVGYLRGWAGAAALFLGPAGVMNALAVLFGPDKPPYPAWPLFAALATMIPLFLVFLYGSTNWWTAAWLVFGAFTAAFLVVHPTVLAMQPSASRGAFGAFALVACNAAFGVLALTRLFSHADDDQARQLGEHLRVPPEVVEAAHGGGIVEWKLSPETGQLVWSIREQAEAPFFDPRFEDAGSSPHRTPSGDRQPTGIW